MSCMMYWAMLRVNRYFLHGFLTLSAADLHWPEMIQAVCDATRTQNITEAGLTDEYGRNKVNIYAKIQLQQLECFQHHVEKFFTEYILSESNPIGKVLEYVIKIEFQMRGSPHAHCLLWVKDSPKINEDPDELVCSFIDKIHNCTNSRINT